MFFLFRSDPIRSGGCIQTKRHIVFGRECNNVVGWVDLLPYSCTLTWIVMLQLPSSLIIIIIQPKQASNQKKRAQRSQEQLAGFHIRNNISPGKSSLAAPSSIPLYARHFRRLTLTLTALFLIASLAYPKSSLYWMHKLSTSSGSRKALMSSNSLICSRS